MNDDHTSSGPDAERERIFEEAAVWLATIEGGTPTHDERKGLAIWPTHDMPQPMRLSSGFGKAPLICRNSVNAMLRSGKL